MKTKMKKMMMLAVAAVLMLSLAACSGKSSNSKEPSNLDEAVAMYQELMEQENQILQRIRSCGQADCEQYHIRRTEKSAERLNRTGDEKK